MAHEPDVLDLLGLVPRELGAVQAHFAPVVVDASRVAHVTAHLQPAFSGAIPGRVLPSALTEAGDPAIAAGTAILLPPIANRVVRWRFSFPVLQAPRDVLFRIEAPVPPNAERIRAAWKLLETVEQPILANRVGAAIDNAGGASLLNIGLHVGLGLAMGEIVIPIPRSVSFSDAELQQGPRQIVRHAAPQSLDGIVASVVAGEAPSGPEGVEVVWEPGMPVPEPAPVTFSPPPRPQAKPEPTRRPCRSCYTEIEVADAEREGMCPMCGSTWY